MMSRVHHALGVIGFATGGKLVLNERQELALSIGMGISSPYTVPWSSRSFGSYYNQMFEQIGKSSVKAGKATGRVAGRMGKRAAMKVATKSTLKLAARAVPVVGWGLLAYDVVDFAVGDDPSFFGDLIDLKDYMM
jgi:hypothetical protein